MSFNEGDALAGANFSRWRSRAKAAGALAQRPTCESVSANGTQRGVRNTRGQSTTELSFGFPAVGRHARSADCGGAFTPEVRGEIGIAVRGLSMRPAPPPRCHRCRGAPAFGGSGAARRRNGRLTSDRRPAAALFRSRLARYCDRTRAERHPPRGERCRPAAILDLIAVFIFALTGGLVASRAQLDIVGFLFLACLTGVGGGTLRDLVLGRDPVFWVGSPHYLGVACAAAILAFFTAHRLESRYQAIVWLDALALSVAAAAGVSIAREAGASWPIILIMGVATGTFGGLMRDVVTNEIPLVLRQGELYVSACLAGALLSVLLLHLFPAAETLSLLTASVATFVLRAGSLRFGWRLPVYRPRAPRAFPPRSAASPGRAPDSAGDDGGAAKP